MQTHYYKKKLKGETRFSSPLESHIYAAMNSEKLYIVSDLLEMTNHLCSKERMNKPSLIAFTSILESMIQKKYIGEIHHIKIKKLMDD